MSIEWFKTQLSKKTKTIKKKLQDKFDLKLQYCDISLGKLLQVFHYQANQLIFQLNKKTQFLTNKIYINNLLIQEAEKKSVQLMQTIQHQIHPKRVDINKLIENLKSRGKMEMNFMEETLKRCSSILRKQPNVLSLQSPSVIVGDIHGQFFDLLNILGRYSLEQNNFLFLGDYVDRGHFCIEVLTLLMVLKIQHPNSVHLLRGNHQSKNMTSEYNFKLQCCKKYSVDIYQKFLDCFKLLPLAAIVDGKYFCVHGGISPNFTTLNELQRIRRNIQVPNKGLLCDLLWSDPKDDDEHSWQDNSIRGISYFYSRSLAQKFLKKNDFKMIIRAHELQDQGYKFQKSNKGKLNEEAYSLTLFSAPNYCDKFKNKGAVAILKHNSIKIENFSEVAHPLVLPNYMDVFEWTLPFIDTCLQHLFKNLVSPNPQKSSKVQPIEEIKKQLQKHERSLLARAVFDQVNISKNEAFPEKNQQDNQNSNQNSTMQQQDLISQTETDENKQNLNIPGPFNLKFHRIHRKKLKAIQESVKLPFVNQKIMWGEKQINC